MLMHKSSIIRAVNTAVFNLTTGVQPETTDNRVQIETIETEYNLK